MAKTATISATPRDDTGKGAARRLRRDGRVPAVMYGHHEETQSLSVDAHELEVLFSHISVENTIIEVSVQHGKKKSAPVRALVREVQWHPYREQVLHVDFYQLHEGEKVEVEVPIRLVGQAAGVKEGGLMQHSLHSVEILCLPDRIPDTLELDVSALLVGDSLHVRDIVAPEGVEIETDADRTVCAVMAPTVLQVEEPEEEEGIEIEGVEGEAAEPELVRRRRGEEEAEEGEAEEE